MTNNIDLNPNIKDSTKIQKASRNNKITDTQFDSWDQYKNSKTRETHDTKVCTYLLTNEANSRQVGHALGIERTAITKTLNTLVKEGRACISSEKPCPITGRRTQFYKSVQKASQPVAIQADLFR